MGYSRSRARCVPLQYPSSATRGVKQVLNLNKQTVNQNLLSTPLQEEKNISEEILNLLSKESTGQVPQLESGIFNELSNKKRMECEKYQDCSWFQQGPIKSECNSKLSQAETFDSFTEANEFDLPVQYANTQTSPWGDEYLEVFTDEIPPEGNFTKLREKNQNFNNNESFYASYKASEDNLFDSCNIDFSLKKTDSVDSMKNTSLTNPAEVIPISYKERLHYSNYGLTKLNEAKSDEIKKEVELYSPESNSYVMDSDDNDLNIGREEIVQEMNPFEDFQNISEKESMSLVQVKPAVSLNKTASECKMLEKISNIKDSKFDNSFKSEKRVANHTICGKIDLNLDIPKLNFEQSINVSTPDLDFMDLVDFINEEMRQENNKIAGLNSVPNGNVKEGPEANEHLVSNENQSDKNNVEISAEKLKHSRSFPQNQSLVGSSVSTDSNNGSTINLTECPNTGVSIAERIKTSAKRKTRSIKDLIQTEVEESCESSDEDDEDDDDDYNCRDDVAKRRSTQMNKRTKSNYLESNGDVKKAKEKNNYRERREKNNEASRRSRQNRKARERHMYETLEEEERRNVKLKAEAEVLEKQVTSLRQLLLQVVLRKGGTT